MPPNNLPMLYDSRGQPVRGVSGTTASRRVAITDTFGAPGFANYSGYVSGFEDRFDDGSRQALYRSYQKMLRDTAIVAAGVHFYLNVLAKQKWSFEPAEADKDQMYADLAEKIMMWGDTSWTQIVRRASLYRFFGFSVMEWTARRGLGDYQIDDSDSALITIKDLEPRPFQTIERWDTDEHGRVMGMIQRSPQTQHEIYLPVVKTLYLVDKALSDSPQGFGLMRSMVSAARQLEIYERLEAIGFENDLRGIPVVRYPKQELDRMVRAGTITSQQAEKWREPLVSFVKKHGRTEGSGIVLDSSTYTTEDEAGRPSNIPKWAVEIMKGGTTALPENNKAIMRKNREMARIMGAEGLLLGDGSTGSYSLSKDKSHIFFLLVDGSLLYMRESAERQLLRVFWRLNGFPMEMMPSLKTEAVRYSDVEQVTASLVDMANAGAPLIPNDPAINDVRSQLGVSPQPEYEPAIEPEEDPEEDPPDDPDDEPEDDDDDAVLVDD